MIIKQERRLSNMCFFCKGTLKEGLTTYFVDLGSCMVIIKNVPCQTCEQCGEVVYNGTVIRRLEAIVKATKNSLTEIAVINYSDKAA
ncbi:MAG: type II toxin-antitoxin system MqsA family antitoxin [Lachnospiraceae bacterium]|nr:type II toxin-antitoxin system MqsA family antitoxin [Lachnospiraceae bacterium]